MITTRRRGTLRSVIRPGVFTSLFVGAFAFLEFARPPASDAADPPSTITSGRCATPPTIDGVLDAGEWSDATNVRFDMQMFRANPLGSRPRRACELRVMNSANALYVLLRVPDPVVNKSVAPLDIDLATLAFCQTDDVARGADRKVLAPGLYVDKHVTEPAKDADDAHQDGRGAVAWEKGRYTFEWAVPLDSKDGEDLKVRLGENVGFNIAFVDGFRPDTKDTEIGGVFGFDLDHATKWGTLRLADRVTDDGGAAFRGPAWLEAAFRGLATPPSNRIRVEKSGLVPGTSAPIGKVDAAYSFRDRAGVDTPARAKLFLPSTVKPGVRLPLVYSAGYELDDPSATGWVEKGYVVATPASLERNPLERTPNADIALLHIVRALPFVDDARVIVTGTSAGGWMAFLLAAETFPLAAVGPDVAPMNWGYNAAYLFRQKDAITPKVPALFGIRPLLEGCLAVYGEDVNDRTWFLHSPLAHLSTITCPVSAVWTTADVLVPMNQIGDRWVRPFDATEFPVGLTMDPLTLTTGDDGRRRLTDLLPDADFEAFVVPMPAGTVRKSVSQAGDARKTVDLPVSAAKRWSIAILDEGAPEPDMDHLKFNLHWTRDAFWKRWVTGKLASDQLTMAKLERLLDRYAGREWMPTALQHLDHPESERSDVMRGLSTYVAASAENGRVFADLYAKLPVDRRVLPADLVAKLSPVK